MTGRRTRQPTTPEAAGDPVAVLRFSAQGEPLVERLDAGRPATVLVAVDQPGQVELEGLGLSAAAEPSTPAHFDVLSERIGSHAVRFTKAGTAETRTVGTLRIVAVGES